MQGSRVNRNLKRNLKAAEQSRAWEGIPQITSNNHLS
jgi:hypothetical protein